MEKTILNFHVDYLHPSLSLQRGRQAKKLDYVERQTNEIKQIIKFWDVFESTKHSAWGNWSTHNKSETMGLQYYCKSYQCSSTGWTPGPLKYPSELLYFTTILHCIVLMTHSVFSPLNSVKSWTSSEFTFCEHEYLSLSSQFKSCG